MFTREECIRQFGNVPVDTFKVFAVQQACRVAMNWELFLRQINQESGYQPCIGSGAGALGIAQIVPIYHPGVDPYDPYAALRYAADLMRSHLDTYGSYRLALTAYNGGGGAVNQLLAGTPYDETVRYLNSILGAGWAEPGPDPACPAQTPSGEPPVEGPPPAMYAGMSSGPSALMVAWIALVALTYLDHSKAGGISR